MGYPGMAGEWARQIERAERWRYRRRLVGAAVLMGLALLAVERAFFSLFN